MTDDEEPARLKSEVRAQMALQMGRERLYGAGEYELDEFEGFTCPECGWRGLSAPPNEDFLNGDEQGPDPLLTECPECGQPGPETSDEPHDWHRVLEKISAADADVTFERHDE